jgi:hypothetical protein
MKSGIENDRLRHIRLHERVNDLPDPNYATLKYFMGHLHKSVTKVFVASIMLTSDGCTGLRSMNPTTRCRFRTLLLSLGQLYLDRYRAMGASLDM